MDNAAYGDQTGQMGYSYSGRSRCYNAPKSYHLGWYRNVSSAFGTTYHLRGVTFPRTSEVPILKVPHRHGQRGDFYLMYNVAAGFNSGTQTARDRVAVALARSPTRSSQFITALNAGDVEILGPSVLVQVGSFSSDGLGQIAPVTVQNGCNYLGDSQSPNCTAWSHRLCLAREKDAGIVQEIGTRDLRIACFDADWYGDVDLETLRTKHEGCDHITKSRTPDCVAAIHRVCLDNGLNAGISQEVGSGGFGVACFNANSHDLRHHY